MGGSGRTTSIKCSMSNEICRMSYRCATMMYLEGPSWQVFESAVSFTPIGHAQLYPLGFSRHMWEQPPLDCPHGFLKCPRLRWKTRISIRSLVLLMIVLRFFPVSLSAICTLFVSQSVQNTLFSFKSKPNGCSIPVSKKAGLQ